MGKYIKPLCEIMEMKENCTLLADSLETFGQSTQKPAYASQQHDITSSSLTNPDLWKEEESDIDYYMEAYKK